MKKQWFFFLMVSFLSASNVLTAAPNEGACACKECYCSSSSACGCMRDAKCSCKEGEHSCHRDDKAQPIPNK